MDSNELSLVAVGADERKMGEVLDVFIKKVCVSFDSNFIFLKSKFARKIESLAGLSFPLYHVLDNAVVHLESHTDSPHKVHVVPGSLL